MGIKSFFGKIFGRTGNGSDGTISDGNGKKDGAKMLCMDCKSMFLFESGEQKFFKMRGLTPPKRCPNCRVKRKRRR